MVWSFHSKRQRRLIKRRLDILNWTLINPNFSFINSERVREKRKSFQKCWSSLACFLHLPGTPSYNLFHSFNFSVIYIKLKLLLLLLWNRNHLLEVLSARDFSTATNNNYSAKGIHSFIHSFFFIMMHFYAYIDWLILYASLSGYTSDRIFAPYSVYKGKAAFSLSPCLPTFTKLDVCFFFLII
jgi:hypothetical protein